jgi:hypothetical protein
MTCNRPPDPSARRAVGGGNRLRASPSAASRPQQKKRTIHVLQNRTSLKTRDSSVNAGNCAKAAKNWKPFQDAERLNSPTCAAFRVRSVLAGLPRARRFAFPSGLPGAEASPRKVPVLPDNRHSPRSRRRRHGERADQNSAPKSASNPHRAHARQGQSPSQSRVFPTARQSRRRAPSPTIEPPQPRRTPA